MVPARRALEESLEAERTRLIRSVYMFRSIPDRRDTDLAGASVYLAWERCYRDWLDRRYVPM